MYRNDKMTKHTTFDHGNLTFLRYQKIVSHWQRSSQTPSP